MDEVVTVYFKRDSVAKIKIKTLNMTKAHNL